MKVENRVEWVAKQVRGKEVLDVGACGHAWKDDLNWLHNEWLHFTVEKEAKTVLGIDIYNEGIRKARELGYNIIYGDAEYYISDRKSDIVLAGDVTEHLNNPGLFLDCAKKNLKKKGKLILTTTNTRHPNEWLTMKASRPDHVQLYNAPTIENLLRRYGFNTEVYYLESKPKTLRGKIYANLFLRAFPEFSCSLGVVAVRSELK